MSGQKRFRVGILGAGYVADYHLRALAAEPDVELVGIADPDLERARALAGRFQIAGAYRDLAEMAAAAERLTHWQSRRN